MPTEQQIIAAERRALMGLLAAVPTRSVDENVLIASWNIAQFSNQKKARALQYIADICERFDVVAIQEVKSNLQGLARLQKLLPGNYQIEVYHTNSTKKTNESDRIYQGSVTLESNKSITLTMDR